jgi:hypothetical protein
MTSRDNEFFLDEHTQAAQLAIRQLEAIAIERPDLAVMAERLIQVLRKIIEAQKEPNSRYLSSDLPLTCL